MTKVVPFNEYEFSALSGLPSICYATYMILRSLMDYETKLVGGPKRRISWQSLCEALYIEPKQGRTNTGMPTKGKLRHTIDILVEAGLIEVKSISTPNQKHLIFYLILAGQDNYASKKLSTNLADDNNTKLTDTNSLISQENACVKKSEVHIAENQNHHTPNIINNKKIKIINHLSPTVITDDYYPSAKLIAQAKDYGCPAAEDKEGLVNFICFCKSKNITSADWDAEYFRWLLRAKKIAIAKNFKSIFTGNQHANSKVNSFTEDSEFSKEPLSQDSNIAGFPGNSSTNNFEKGNYRSPGLFKSDLWEKVKQKLE